MYEKKEILQAIDKFINKVNKKRAKSNLGFKDVKVDNSFKKTNYQKYYVIHDDIDIYCFVDKETAIIKQAHNSKNSSYTVSKEEHENIIEEYGIACMNIGINRYKGLK